MMASTILFRNMYFHMPLFLLIFVSIFSPWISAVEAYSPVLIFAEKAVQSDLTSGFSISGGLSIKEESWQIIASTGLINGPLTDADVLEVAGNPASIRYAFEDKAPLLGSGLLLTYDVENQTVDLRGEAEISAEAQLISSDWIHYDLETGTWEAGQQSRVRIRRTIR
jgi:lipopolysaccharide transport protein LptA